MNLTKVSILAINTIATLVVATAVIMAATFILFFYLDSANGIKDAWSTIAGFFGGFATLTAAYIASKLFNDWRDIEKFKRHAEISEKIYYIILSIHKNLSELSVLSYNKAIYSEKRRIAKIIRDELHYSVTYIALDHMKSIKDNQNIQKLYEILKSQRNLHRRYEATLKQDSKLQPSNFNNSDKLLNNNLNELNKCLDQMVNDNLR
ncbi:hypothetical protein ACG907_02525 [Acinetobacter bereziniae]|uniref:hypothetical protein n=1 Tax=Acinetobacter bereziniae TaxID=106648 RepID=UPI003AF7F86C